MKFQVGATKIIRSDMPGSPRQGRTVYKTMDVGLIRSLLIAKLHEEAQEVASAKTELELTKEIGDIYDVLDALCIAYDIPPAFVEDCRHLKREQRGSLVTVDTAGRVSATLYGLAKV